MRTNEIPPSLRRKFRNRLSPYWQRVYDVGLSTGWRVNDILQLRLENFYPGNIVVITASKTKRTSAQRLSKSLVRRLRDNRVKNVIFPSPRNPDVPVSRQACHRAFKRAADALLLERVAPHSMRKSYAHDKHRAGASLKELQEALQHDRVETTLLYLINNYDELIAEALKRSVAGQ